MVLVITLVQRYVLSKTGTSDAFRVDDQASDTTPFVIDDSGNVGIGTNAPEVELDLMTGTINAAQICDEDNANCLDLSGGAAAQELDDLSDVITDWPNGGLYIGQGAGAAGPTGLENTIIGIDAGAATVAGTDNVFIGARAGNANVGGSFSVMIGEDAGRNATGDSNTLIGANITGAMTGGLNTYVGRQAGNGTTSGQSNIAMGAFTGDANLDGSYNIYLGESAATNITTGSWNTIVGQNAAQTLTSGSGNILLGQGVDVPAAATSNHINIGNTIYGNRSTGSVGIGTTAPGFPLHIESNSTITQIRTRSGAAGSPASITLGRTSNDLQFGAAASGSNFSNIAAGGDAVVKAITDDLILVSNNGDIKFSTGAADSLKFIVDNSGNVGVGTQTPTSKT